MAGDASETVGNFNEGGLAARGGWGNNEAKGEVIDELLGTMVGEWCKLVKRSGLDLRSIGSGL